MKEDLNSSEYSLTVSRALSILSLFTPDRTEVTLAEISRSTDLSKQSVLRFIKSMMAHGYLEQDRDTKKYRPGIETFRVGSLVADPEARRLARPVLRELSEAYGFSSYLSLMRPDSMIVLATCEGNSILRFSLPVGHVVPLNNTSSGQAALSALSDDEVSQVFDTLPFAGGNDEAPQDLPALLDRLNEVRTRGYAISWGMSAPGIGSVSAPVLSGATRRPLVMTIGFGTGQIRREALGELGDKVRGAADQLGDALDRARGPAGV